MWSYLRAIRGGEDALGRSSPPRLPPVTRRIGCPRPEEFGQAVAIPLPRVLSSPHTDLQTSAGLTSEVAAGGRSGSRLLLAWLSVRLG